ncbi:nuclear speckle splicing regulatory protein 1-like [Impatiens glandulifera]|uniref:nuclear speckle splicing regulatory protein 1-like n=1 Tax=Impatiens glandulifera TaxID=253017 RepID=UPI001FB18482|nr:nuclear speckle splicing regulatory protein 1-like [Impatiens glandulifera]
MKKYGLNLRVQPNLQKNQSSRPPLPKPLGFRDDDEDDVEKEISRQASKNKSNKDIEEQHRKALEEDPSVFDYDGVYDDMKGKMALPRVQDRQERKPKYIQALMDKAKAREREQEIVYERKLAKERNQEDHLYVDKDKFVTAAYKRKLAEQAKWMEEERVRQLREEKDDVTKKKDISDFYFNLGKNVAYGANEKESTTKFIEKEDARDVKSVAAGASSAAVAATELPPPPASSSSSDPVKNSTITESTQQPLLSETEDKPRPNHDKRGEDALAAAKERFLARKKSRQQ